VSIKFDIHYEGKPLDQVVGIRAITFGDYPRALGVKGIQKLVDRYMKALLTPKGTDLSDPEYGTHLAAALGNNVDPGTLSQLASRAVADAEGIIRAYDAEYGTPDDERLFSVDLENLVIDPEGNGVTLDVRLKSVEGAAARISLPLLFSS